MTKEEKQREAYLLYQQKITDFQDAIYQCEVLKGLVRYETHNGFNDYDDRYWSAIFHKENPDLTLDKETRLCYNFGGMERSVIFVYDHETKQKLCVSSADDEVYFFAQYFSEKNLLITQLNERLVIHSINPETFCVQRTIDSNNISTSSKPYFEKRIERVVFEKTGMNYFAIFMDGRPILIKINSIDGIEIKKLSGYMTRFGMLYGLWVKEIENSQIVVLGISRTDVPDPDMGYSLFIPNDDDRLCNYKNEFFQSWHVTNVTFGEKQENDYIKISVFSRKLLVTESIVPANFDVTKR